MKNKKKSHVCEAEWNYTLRYDSWLHRITLASATLPKCRKCKRAFNEIEGREMVDLLYNYLSHKKNAKLPIEMA